MLCRESLLCCVIKPFLIVLPTLLTCIVDCVSIISERESPKLVYLFKFYFLRINSQKVIVKLTKNREGQLSIILTINLQMELKRHEIYVKLMSLLCFSGKETVVI